MRKKFFVITIASLFVIGLYAIGTCSSDPNQPIQPPKPVDLKSIPLMDHLIKPPGTWLTAYADQSIERVTYAWNFAAIIARVNAQQSEINALKDRLAALEKDLKPTDQPLELKK